ncbi:hypothetical protein C4D60_Mb01t31850 [Musa balbisiana]|uniref:Uncharacterized protein n=1 Tax=Musa balbisiana TaxID=52838 RepID=A0A4S8JS63_MUSBA|nr:hypothetical protein C4D60_Mb01t31850 [Musa balbisiana]
MNESRSYPSLPFLPRPSVRLTGQDEEISDSPETGVAIANLRFYSYRLLSPRSHSRFHLVISMIEGRIRPISKIEAHPYISKLDEASAYLAWVSC